VRGPDGGKSRSDHETQELPSPPCGDETIFCNYNERVEYENIVGNVIIIKDEAEGLTGRLVYEAPVKPARPRWRKKKPL
jgi:hypothetical protein